MPQRHDDDGWRGRGTTMTATMVTAARAGNDDAMVQNMMATTYQMTTTMP